MSTEHLSTGSTCPPKVDGKLRLYSMAYCPFAQRVRIVLNAKNIPHDIVNVNLKNKPEWIFTVHPKGLVPALDTEDEVVTESLDIAEFLDEKYPEPRLRSDDPDRRARDKELIAAYGKVVGHVSSALYNKDDIPIDTHVEAVCETLAEFESELGERGTTFFGGDDPGMVDFMLWPWVERAKLPSILRENEFSFPKDKYPKMLAWRNALKEVKAVKDTITDQATHVKFLKGYFSGSSNPPFDNL